jgi:hypothetical protein
VWEVWWSWSETKRKAFWRWERKLSLLGGSERRDRECQEPEWPGSWRLIRLKRVDGGRPTERRRPGDPQGGEARTVLPVAHIQTRCCLRSRLPAMANRRRRGRHCVGTLTQVRGKAQRTKRGSGRRKPSVRELRDPAGAHENTVGCRDWQEASLPGGLKTRFGARILARNSEEWGTHHLLMRRVTWFS